VCYGRGGDLPTVTDADVVLGRIDPQRFAGGSIKLASVPAEDALTKHVGGPLKLYAQAAALAVSEIVEENMANAARVHAMELGKTVEDYTLIAFGGAAPLHAVRLAQKLGIRRIVVPEAAAVGSALGFLWAPVAFHALRSRYQKLGELAVDKTNTLLAQMRRSATEIVRGGAGNSAIRTESSAYMRYVGQGHEITVRLPQRALRARDRSLLRAAFETEYARLYGRAIPHLDIEILSWSLVAYTAGKPGAKAKTVRAHRAPPSHDRRPLYDARTQRFRKASIYDRSALTPGTRLSGPALVVEDQTTTVVETGFSATVNSLGYLILEAK
jgi:N-methylhydantoinase A